MRQKLIAATLKQLLKLLNNTGLTPDEVVLLLGNFCYSIGAALSKKTREKPTIQELELSYMTQPTISVFLMLTGVNIVERVATIGEGKNRKKEKENENE